MMTSTVSPGLAGTHSAYNSPRDLKADEELARVGRGTPCGEYFRRFWHPLAYTEEVTDLPLKVRVLGEDLVLLRALLPRSPGHAHAGWAGNVNAIAPGVLRVVAPAPRDRRRGAALEAVEPHRMKRERTLPPDLEGIVFDEAEIATAVRSIAARIARDHAGEELLLIGVLKGAVHFLSDLARALDGLQPGPARLYLDVIAVSSYGNAGRSSGEVRLIQDTTHPVEGRRVLLVEDIVDNGLTLAYLYALLGARNPRSLRSAALLDKPYRRSAAVEADYVGLTCPDAFVVGYGLDYQERYRTLPYIAKLRPDVFSDPE